MILGIVLVKKVKSMKKTIVEQLREIERSNNVRILLAVESGSRAWGFASPDSDYDVRFIYARKKEDYLRLDEVRDVIELPINEMLDINGWDLRKTLQLLYRSNPTLFEWFSSPIIYLETPLADRFRHIMQDYFSTKKSLYHYISMAEGNYREYLKGDMVRAKKYFYVLRPLLACRWVMEKKTPPPMLFSELAEAELPEYLKEDVDRLLDIKMNSPEVKLIPKEDSINRFMDNEIQEIKGRVSEIAASHDNGWEQLNEFFLQAVERAWNPGI